MATMVQQEVALPHKELVDRFDASLWGRLTHRIAAEEKVALERAEQLMNETIGFLKLCTLHASKEAYSPSPLVDIGWHTFILYTEFYGRFCHWLGGRFIHHSPLDEEGAEGSDGVRRTLEAMKHFDIAADETLWEDDSMPCEAQSDQPGGWCKSAFAA